MVLLKFIYYASSAAFNRGRLICNVICDTMSHSCMRGARGAGSARGAGGARCRSATDRFLCFPACCYSEFHASQIFRREIITPDMHQMPDCGGMSLVGKTHPTFLHQTKNLKIYGKNSGFSLCLNLSRATFPQIIVWVFSMPFSVSG